MPDTMRARRGTAEQAKGDKARQGEQTLLIAAGRATLVCVCMCVCVCVQHVIRMKTCAFRLALSTASTASTDSAARLVILFRRKRAAIWLDCLRN